MRKTRRQQGAGLQRPAAKTPSSCHDGEDQRRREQEDAQRRTEEKRDYRFRNLFWVDPEALPIFGVSKFGYASELERIVVKIPGDARRGPEPRQHGPPGH